MRSPLLESLFDYAGVFPPAALPVEAAQDEYRAAVASPHGWVLGPMLTLASQRDRLVAPGRLGLVADAPIDADAGPLEQVEARAAASDVPIRVEALRHAAPVLYLESPDAGDLTVLDAIAAARTHGARAVDVRAKIRTGGATAAAFPSPDVVAAFITACVALEVPFKATAGLHHPVRQVSDVPDATEHGFLNMLAATRCALTHDEAATLGALRETDIAAFDVTSATWRGVGADIDPAAVRATFCSIGSCSVEEPTSYLVGLGML